MLLRGCEGEDKNKLKINVPSVYTVAQWCSGNVAQLKKRKVASSKLTGATHPTRCKTVQVLIRTWEL